MVRQQWWSNAHVGTIVGPTKLVCRQNSKLARTQEL